MLFCGIKTKQFKYYKLLYLGRQNKVMILKKYQKTENNFWVGRIDSEVDKRAFRMHQIIELCNLLELTQKQKLTPCFLGYCTDEGIKRNFGRLGAKEGPFEIRKAFASLPASFMNQFEVADAGNLFCKDNNMEEVQNDLANSVEELLKKNYFPIVLGGGHDIAFGNYNGIKKHLIKQHGNDVALGIINIDAHFDLRPYDKGTSSGTMFSQIADNCVKENRTFNYMCLGIQPAGNTQLLFDRADKLNTKYLFAEDCNTNTIETIKTEINTFINNNDFIYLTLCSDVINSAYAPGVSAIQPFGLDPKTIVEIIRAVAQSKKLISFDVAEVSPSLDKGNKTSKLIGLIIYELMSSLSKINNNQNLASNN